MLAATKTATPCSGRKPERVWCSSESPPFSKKRLPRKSVPATSKPKPAANALPTGASSSDMKICAHCSGTTIWPDWLSLTALELLLIR